ncbi:hypothetical protein L484_025861 [Morus notabilis]|uniref:Uncharacterized protein n=1 Tax=Morus notabilis TaxID=981085 RepID=W9RD45_9ROSA|nr:hypothetical protein L484_025861 [Morus notabilis]
MRWGWARQINARWRLGARSQRWLGYNRVGRECWVRPRSPSLTPHLHTTSLASSLRVPFLRPSTQFARQKRLHLGPQQ